jgi:hypothetical protein
LGFAWPTLFLIQIFDSFVKKHFGSAAFFFFKDPKMRTGFRAWRMSSRGKKNISVLTAVHDFQAVVAGHFTLSVSIAEFYVSGLCLKRRHEARNRNKYRAKEEWR